MKLDPDLTLQILEKVGIYSSRFSISEPQILLTTKEVLDAPKEMTEEDAHLHTSIMEYPIFYTTLYSLM